MCESFGRENDEDDGGLDEDGNKPCVGLCYLNKLQTMGDGGEGGGHPVEVGISICNVYIYVLVGQINSFC